MASQVNVDFRQEDAEQILAASPGGILIGGAALSFWRSDSAGPLPPALSAGVTLDIDFFGGRRHAEELARAIKDLYHTRVEVYLPSLDDFTPNSAKLCLFGYGGRPENTYLEIDYLSSVYGFDESAIERMKSRAPMIDGESSRFQIMHPLDVLLSRVHNLAGLPSKQNSAGRAQAEMAVGVVYEFFLNDLGVGDAVVEKKGIPGVGGALKAAEELIRFARSKHAAVAYRDFGVDVLVAIPADHFATDQFRAERWPRALEWVERKRAPRARIRLHT